MSPSNTNVYCLLCEDNTYYIGKASNVEKRFRKHKSGNGSLWTRTHAPIKIIEIRENVSPFEEDKMVKEYMYNYGIDKVRGGSYIQIKLNSCQLYNLRRELWMATDHCFQCGYKHYCRDCKFIVIHPNNIIGLVGLLLLIIIILGIFSKRIDTVECQSYTPLCVFLALKDYCHYITKLDQQTF
jgi:predicted GIY-YIG superfamily endonuclease